MRRIALVTLSVVALVASAVTVRAGHGSCCGSGGCATAGCGTDCGYPKPILRAEIVQTKCEEKTKVIPPYVVTKKETFREVPVCCPVEVPVIDPCTGCTRIEHQQQTVVQKARVIQIEVVPPKEDCLTKTEVKTRNCIKIYIDHAPAAVCAPAPACVP
jgi:hypothetical protein